MAVNIPINLEPTLDKSALSILEKQIDDIKKDLTDVSKVKLGDEKGFADAYAKRQKAVEELTVALQALKQVSDSIGNKISMGDTSGLRSDIQTLQELKGIILDIDSLLNDARSVSLPTTNISAITEDSVRLNNAMQGVTSALRSTREASDVAFTGMQSRLDNLKSGFYKLGQIIGTSLRDSLSQSWSILKKYFGLIKSGFTSLFNHIKKGFSAKDTTSGIGNLINQLKSLLGVFALTRLTKSMMSLTNEAINMEGTLNNVFEDSSSAIRDWSNEFADRFTLTIQQARSFATQFGGVLQNLGITGGTQTSMAENLTALSGDFASFYGTSVSDAADRLQAAIIGQTRGLKALGIQMNDTLLSQFALNRGYQQAYSAMSEQNKAIVRYNYLLAQTVTQQGNAATSSMGWTNQVRMLKQQLSTLGSVIGGGFVKLLYPVVQVLNKILYAVNVVAQKIAKLFGFDVQSVGEYLGVDNVGGISDASDAINEEADALDNAGKAAKKASKGLASFDKLNNQTSESTSGASGGIGGGGIGGLIDADSYFENIPDVNKGNKFLDWLNELYDLLSNKQWEKAGEHVASGINAISDSLYDMLKGDKLEKKIHSFNDGLTDFFKGLLKIDTNKIGKNVGAVINKITYTLTDLYKQLSGKGILKGAGKKISQFFNGLFDEVDFRQLGQTLMLKFSTVFEVLRGFLDDAKDSDLGTKLGTSIKNFILGILDMIDPDEVGSSLGDLLNLGFDALIALLGGSDGKSLGAEIGGKIVGIFNTAVKTIDPKKMQQAFSGILNFFGDLFGSAKDWDTDTLANNITSTINGAVEDGSVANLTAGITTFLGKLVGLFAQVAVGINWGELISAICSGIGEGLSNLSDADKEAIATALKDIFEIYIALKAAGWVLSSLGKSIMGAIGNGLFGNEGILSNTISSILGGSIVKNAAIAAVAGWGIYEYLKGRVEDALEQENWQKEFDNLEQRLTTGNWAMDVSILVKEKNIKDLETASKNVETLRQKIEEINKISETNGIFDRGIAWGEQNDFKETVIEYANALDALGISSDSVRDKLNKIWAKADIDYQEDALYKLQDAINITMGEAEALDSVWDTARENENFKSFIETRIANDESLMAITASDLAKMYEEYEEYESKIQIEHANIQSILDLAVDEEGKNLLFKAAEYGRDAGLLAPEEFANVISTDEESGNSLLNLANENYNELITKVLEQMREAGELTPDEYAKAVETNAELVKRASATMTDMLSDGIDNGKSDVKESAETVVVDAATAAKAEAIEGGKEVSEEYVKQVVETINTDTSIQTAVADNITKSANEAKDEAKAGGETLADEYIKAFKDKITSDTTMKVDALKKLKEVLSSLVSDIKSGSKEIGLAIIDGIIDGVNNNAYKLTNKMKELAKSALKSAKDELDIHSPSRVFRDQIGQNIVLGLVEGISDEEIAVQDEMQNIRNIMMQPFETRDMSKYFDFSGINDVIINPSVNKAKLASGLAMEQSTQGILGSLASLGNKTNKLANGTTVINVYLDKDNKLDTYIVDAVNKNTVKGGGF